MRHFIIGNDRLASTMFSAVWEGHFILDFHMNNEKAVVDGHTVEIQERVSAFPQQYMMGVTE
jgi:hypothetical protein